MTFPTYQSAAKTSGASLTSPITTNLPASIAAGDLLLMQIVRNGTSQTLTLPSGWTLLITNDQLRTTNRRHWFAYKHIVGGDAEIGASTMSISSTVATAQTTAIHVQRWTGVDTAQAPQITSIAGADNSTAPNSGSITPAWGAEDTAFISCAVWGTETMTVSAWPANYTTGQDGVQSLAAAGCAMSARLLNATSDDPGAYTLTGTGSPDWEAYTVAIRTASIVAYTVTADLGTYAYTGVAAGVLAGYKVIADVGTYVLSGVAAITKSARLMAAALGTYTYTGVDAILRKGQILICDVGAYTYTGVANILRAIVSMPAAVGTYAYTGVAANLIGAMKVVAAAGAYTYTGVAATLTKGQRMLADVGAYVLTGQIAFQRVVLRHLTGTYAYTGIAAALDGSKRLLANAGSYTLSGLNAVMVYRLPLERSAAWVKRKAEAMLAKVRQTAPSLLKGRSVQSKLSRKRQNNPKLGD